MRQFDLDAIRHITFFEESTGSKVRDCIVNGDSVYFLVEKDNMKKALGKNGSNIKTIQNKLNKRVKVWEYTEDPKAFIKNLIPEAESITINGTKANVKIPSKDKGKIIGREGSNIKNLKEILKRNSEIEDLIC